MLIEIQVFDILQPPPELPQFQRIRASRLAPASDAAIWREADKG